MRTLFHKLGEAHRPTLAAFLLSFMASILAAVLVTLVARPVYAGATANGILVKFAKYSTSPTALTSGDEAQYLLVDSLGRLQTTPGSGPAGGDTITNLSPTASNGATAVTLLAGTASQKIYPVKLVFYNLSTTADHLVTLQSSTGPQVLIKFPLAKGSSAQGGGAFFLDNDWGWVQTLTADSLQIVIDTVGGAAADVVVSGILVKK